MSVADEIIRVLNVRPATTAEVVLVTNYPADIIRREIGTMLKAKKIFVWGYTTDDLFVRGAHAPLFSVRHELPA